MHTALKAALLASALTVAMVGYGHAQDRSAGMVPDGPATPRSMGMEKKAERADGPPASRMAGEEQRGMMDADARVKALGIIKKTRGGGETRMDAPPAVIDAIRGDRADAGGGAGAADELMEAERKVIGSDSREHVPDTTVYPFDVVGFIETSHEASGTRYSCTGALVGPRVVLTAASCIYQHEIEGDWMESVRFWPGINGPETVPFGPYDWKTAYIMNGFVDEYDGSYSSIWPYDLALVVLDEPVGEELGWLGYGLIPAGGGIVNLIGYQSDKEDFTQWRTDCDISARALSSLYFSHGCDAADWSMGAPMYVYIEEENSRRVVGTHMGGLDDTSNWALRFDEPVLKWIDSINE